MDCKNKYNKGCCSTDMGRGCKFCNCGEEATAQMCEGCFKLHSTDWLADVPDMFPTDIFEVRFKNTRRSYFKNVNNLPLERGDIVAVEASPGHDIGIISLTGDMVARQMKRVGFTPLNGEFKKIYRKVKPYDIEKWQEAIAMEHETMIRSRQIAADMKLNMKIGDVEYQGDKIKAIFYYIADERVDFRELIKVFADQFRIRVEMKQIGARQEAGRIGGLGSCGRELCCASWVSSFVSVTTNAARTQEISLNPQKLAGQCGKLKCCLVYELDSYIDARREFPRVNQPLQAMDGEYYLVKTDILGRTMSFSTSPNSMAGLVTIPIKRVKEILDANYRGKKVDKIIDDTVQEVRVEEPNFVNAIGEDSITRFDKKRGERSRNRNRKEGAKSNGNGNGSGNSGNGNGGNKGQQAKGSQQPKGAKPNGQGESKQQSNRNNDNKSANAGSTAGNNGAATANGSNNGRSREGGENGNRESGNVGANRNRNKSRNNRNRNGRNREGGENGNGGNSEGSERNGNNEGRAERRGNNNGRAERGGNGNNAGNENGNGEGNNNRPSKPTSDKE